MFRHKIRFDLWSRWADSFGALKVHPRLLHGLEAKKHLRPTFCQAEAFKPISKGQDCLIYAETGSGKTLAYLLPALNRIYHLHDMAKNVEGNPLAFERPLIILCPTVDLCAQVAAFIHNIDADNLISVQGLGKAWGTWPTHEEKPAIIHPRIRWGSVDVVVSTPVKLVEDMERFGPDGFIPSAVVLDEFDLLMQGATRTYLYDVFQKFRPRLKIRQADEPRERLPKMLPIQFIFAAATVIHIGPFSAGNMVIERFGSAVKVESPRFHAVPDSISQDWIDASEDWDARVQQLVALLKHRPVKTLVFVNSAWNCRVLTDFLKKHEWPVVSYSRGPWGRMGPRMGDVAKFVDGLAVVNILTDFGGRGIDWPDVEHVINFQMPRDAMSWVHRVGRTGRIGKTGFVTNMVGPKDQELAERLQHRPVEETFSCKRSLRKKKRRREGAQRNVADEGDVGRTRWAPAETSASSSIVGWTLDSDSEDEQEPEPKQAGFDRLREKLLEDEGDEFDWASLGVEGRTLEAPSRKMMSATKASRGLAASSRARTMRGYRDMDDDVRL